MIAHRLRTDATAQATVEFALVVPVALLLIIGLIEFGRAWNGHQVITDAAREGARSMVIANPAITQQTVDSVIRNALVRGNLNGYGAPTTITLSGWRAGTGSPASVTVQYAYRFVFIGPLLQWTTGQRTVTLSSQAVMRNE
jgi:Flp pilus assembly protein TadG